MPQDHVLFEGITVGYRRSRLLNDRNTGSGMEYIVFNLSINTLRHNRDILDSNRKHGADVNWEE